MGPYDLSQIHDVSREFQIYGDLRQVEPCKIGHINETYVATYNQGGAVVRYVHQKVNTEVFRDPAGVMDNIGRVTRHQRARLEGIGTTDVTRRVLTVVPTRDGETFHQTAKGQCWRTFVFIENVRTYESVTSPALAQEAGRAFGEFQRLLSDLPGKRLVETIPDFHNSRRRFDSLVGMVGADQFNRAKSAAPEVKFAMSREKIVDVILKAMARKQIPERATHNDTKFNNVMVDCTTGKATCVVDLDTVMPGCALYDFGDMVRTTTSPTLEDELDLSKVHARMPLFRALCRGYLEATEGMLNKHERALIAFAGQVLTFTIGLRFLTDYLAGDTYFRVHRPGHNLERARTQFRLVESLERQAEEMQKYADSI
ncbi:MAG: aminoglycoside phosphotransferase family protein [Verrucomicrobia bacterium]|nr:MAG: aminoglycoside phosphotransferase family protein [Verrucomicrobiota bacterium]